MLLRPDLINFASMKEPCKLDNSILIIESDAVIANSNPKCILEATHLFNAGDLRKCGSLFERLNNFKDGWLQIRVGEIVQIAGKLAEEYNLHQRESFAMISSRETRSLRSASIMRMPRPMSSFSSSVRTRTGK